MTFWIKCRPYTLSPFVATTQSEPGAHARIASSVTLYNVPWYPSVQVPSGCLGV